ncbi:MAG: substrate-binding domain-containing protein, partial [Promicromonosporaceae bacterium]|nr:substrate-binding domain-containing protein [Promicromonosporaceae bacterium]
DIANPFFTAAAQALQHRLAQDDWTLMLAASDDDAEAEARVLRLFEQHGLQGVAVVPAGDDVSHLARLAERAVAVVLLDRPSPVETLSSVAVDDVAGGRLAAEHLLALGHERIVLLNGPHSVRQCADRHAGVVAALVAAGRDPEVALEEITVRLDASGGEAGAEALLARAERPSAVFCVNDLVALGVLRTLRRSGVSVPRDVAVVGYDDVSFAAELTVPLTSVRQPGHDLGRTAAELLLRGPGAAPQQVVFQPELVVRDSSGR